MADKSRLYVIDSESEPDRLEAQARLAGIEHHLEYIPLKPDDLVLDAGCGSGSMSRLLAQNLDQGQVVGVDVDSAYLEAARKFAEIDGLSNVTFKEGDIFKLPFDDDTFDLVWSKYVLQWVNDPFDAVTEFKRVTKPGGLIVCCNFDGFGITHYPEDSELQSDAEKIFPASVDPFVGRKMFNMFHEAGLADIIVNSEPDRLFNCFGSIDPERRLNWSVQFDAAKDRWVDVLGSSERVERFINQFLSYQDRADTATLCHLFFVRGTVP
jgi:ubiquinone/menaquinone biosynthesis C-methylase UbiE